MDFEGGSMQKKKKLISSTGEVGFFLGKASLMMP